LRDHGNVPVAGSRAGSRPRPSACRFSACGTRGGEPAPYTHTHTCTPHTHLPTPTPAHASTRPPPPPHTHTHSSPTHALTHTLTHTTHTRTQPCMQRPAQHTPPRMHAQRHRARVQLEGWPACDCVRGSVRSWCAPRVLGAKCEQNPGRPRLQDGHVHRPRHEARVRPHHGAPQAALIDGPGSAQLSRLTYPRSGAPTACLLSVLRCALLCFPASPILVAGRQQLACFRCCGVHVHGGVGRGAAGVWRALDPW
jgi:hypothetical protein